MNQHVPSQSVFIHSSRMNNGDHMVDPIIHFIDKDLKHGSQIHFSTPIIIQSNTHHYSAATASSPPQPSSSPLYNNSPTLFRPHSNRTPLVPSINVSSIKSNNSSGSSHSTPNSMIEEIPISNCIPLLKLKSLSAPSPSLNSHSTPSSSSPRSLYYVPEGTTELSPFMTPTQSPRTHITSTANSAPPSGSITPTSSSINSMMSLSLQSNFSTSPNKALSLPTTPLSSPRDSSNNLDKIEEHWRKLEFYTNNLNHFVYESIKSKDFSGFQELNEKVEDIKNSMKEIEIMNNIVKTLPPQTRARKKRSTKAELQKDKDSSALTIKRTYVTTPKSKGNHCAQCGTLETPEWRKGPGGHKTLCNACGLHYAKNLKRENINKKLQNSPTPNDMKISNLLE